MININELSQQYKEFLPLYPLVYKSINSSYVDSGKIRRTRWVKCWVREIITLDKECLCNKICLGKYGPIVWDYDKIEEELYNEGWINRDIVYSKIEDKYKIYLEITEKGTTHFKNITSNLNLNKFEQNISILNSVIVDTLNTQNTIEQIVKKIYHEHPEFYYNESVSNTKVVELLFDWGDFGTAVTKIYHRGILYSSMKLFGDIKRKSEIIKDITLPSGIININNITEKMFKDPLNMSGNHLIEGKNFLRNRWYLIEIISCLNSLFGIKPTVREIAKIAVINPYLDIDTIWNPNERIEMRISRDIRSLEKNKFIIKNADKIINYELNAKKFYDPINDKIYIPCSHTNWEKLYNNLCSNINESRGEIDDT